MTGLDWSCVAVRARVHLLMALLLVICSCARKGEPEPAPKAEPDPVELDLWAGVPALEPTAEALHGELVPKPGPPRPEQVGEELDLPFPPPAPAEDGPVGATDLSDEALEVTRFGPEGEQSIVDAIRVSFNHPMVPLASIEALGNHAVPVEIEPEVAGEFRWMGTRTVAFFPEGRLPYSTDYEIRIAEGTQSELGTSLAKPVSWTISTPTLAIERVEPRGDHVELDRLLALRFNQAVDEQAVAATLRLGKGKSAIELESVPAKQWDALAKEGAVPGWILGEGEDWERARIVVLRPKQPLKPNTSYRVELPPGTYGEGSRRSTKLAYDFRTYGPLKLSVRSCSPSPCSASAGITLVATNAIRDAALASKIHVSPEVEGLRIDAYGRGIQLSGELIGNSSYTIEVDAGLEDRFGQQLAKPFKKRVKLGALEPGLRIFPEAKNPGIVEERAAHTIQLEVTGLREIELMASSFSSAKLDDYLPQRNHGNYWRAEGWPEVLGEPRRRKTLDVSKSLARRQVVSVELDPFVRGADNFVYLLARSNVFERYGSEERELISEVVQITNIGLSAAFDRDDAIVLVTDLATGAPVEGAELRLLDDEGRREVWLGKSDAKGVARPRYAKAMLSQPLVVAKLGDDEAFLPIGEGDLEQRWNGHLFGREAEAEVRAMMFTERTPYKPGETAHLVGILRRETRGPRGGVELWGAGRTASYTFRSPRGVEVGEGEVELSPFGTFSVDLETDENGDTGDYVFELRIKGGLFGRERAFSQRIPVETFRTPEFEVNVERERSDPLYFGDELAVVVEGRYLFGAPMIGAELGYSFRRTATDFRPPAEGLSGFHFASSPGYRWGGFGYGMWAPNPSIMIESGNKQLDERGRFELRHSLTQVEPKPAGAPESETGDGADSDEPPRPQAATFTLDATVIDENRQAIAGSGSFVVHPGAYYVGLRSERSVLREGEATRVEAVVVDVEGKRVEGVEVELHTLRKQTTRVPVERGGAWQFDYETETTEVSSCTLRSTVAVTGCELEVGAAGTHEVTAEIHDAEGRRNMAAIELYVHGDEAVIWDDEQRRVDLVADKDSYEPGETAKILVRSPFDQARGFLVVEREGMAATHALEVEGGVAIVEVDIAPEMVSGVTLSAVLTKPRTAVSGVPSDQDLGAPAVASGRLPLEVSEASKTIVVGIEPEHEQIAPGETLTIEVDTRGTDGKPISAAVVLFVVDEGVLNLMNYQTPRPLDYFHHRRAEEVGLFADHSMILPRTVAEQPDPVAAQHALTPDEPNVVDLPDVGAGAFALGDDDQGVWGGVTGTTTTEAYGVGGLGLIGTGRGGGGVGEGSIGLNKDEEAKPAERARAGPAPAAPPPPPGGGKLDANQAMAQPVSLRTLFATTALFEADVRTDAEGRARVEVEMPENLTSFRIMAVAVDPEVHDRFGSGEASVRVRKPIMLRPSLPRFLNLGDRFEASVMVDNQTESRQTVLVGTRGLNVELPGAVESSVEIPAGESRELRFEMAVDHVGTMRLQFAALANGGRDATELDIPVLTPATKQAFADYGVTSDSVLRTIEPPVEALPGFGGLEISMSSTALNGLEDAVEFLVTYPYECSEQTASRLLPIFALGEVLDEFPIAEVHDLARRDALARAGIERLFRRQNWDGGFGYWGDERNESWPYVSTWVTLALLEGKRAGYEVDAVKLDQALNYLDSYVRNGVRTRWGVYYDWTTRAFALWLLAREGRGKGSFATVWGERERMPLYARVLLASAAHRYGKKRAVEEILTELRERVVEDARVIHFAESTSEAGAADGLAVLMHSSTQTDAIALMTLIELGEELGDEGMAAKIMAGLMADRDPRIGGRWSSTHANAWALMAASRYFEAMESETPDFLARIWLDAEYAGEHAFEGRDMSKVNLEVPMAKLLGSKVESLTLQKDGPGKLYYRLGLRYAPADFEMAAVDRGFSVTRRYEALADPGADAPDPDAVVQLEDGSWRIEAGTSVRVTLTLVAQHRANFVVVDDPFPAGFEGQNPRFVTSVDPASVSSVNYGYGGLGPYYGHGGYARGYGHGGWWYPWFHFDHTQMRDDRMLLFADQLPAGVYTYSYTARATNIGTFVLPPVHAEAMYEPERFGHGSSSRVEIVAPN